MQFRNFIKVITNCLGFQTQEENVTNREISITLATSDDTPPPLPPRNNNLPSYVEATRESRNNRYRRRVIEARLIQRNRRLSAIRRIRDASFRKFPTLEDISEEI